MNKAKLAWSKLSLVTFLSLGFIVLGVGSISWALFIIWVQSDYSADATRSYFYIPSIFATEVNKITEDGITLVEPDSSLVLPVTEKTPYPVYLAEGDYIGSLTIPALNRELSILRS